MAIMKNYKALVYDKLAMKYVVIEDSFCTKAEFIKELRRTGYRVNPDKVKPAHIFDYILNNTNMNSWDWNIRKIEE